MLKRVNLVIGGLLGIAVLGMALLALVWTPVNPLQISVMTRLRAPYPGRWFGTDEFGRDILSRVMSGASVSLSLAAVTVIFAVVLGTCIGLVTGYFRGWVDRVVMLFNDALLAFPGILIALGLVAVIGASKAGIVLALGIAYTPKVVRVVRGNVLSLRKREFVEASSALGNGALYTMFRHILPNTLTPIAVLATSMFGWVILAESALSFLGLGVPPPSATWGNMLASARPYLSAMPSMSIIPGAFIAMTLLAINLLGDALRDWLDPRM
ncbi:MAG: peptide transporter [Rhizobacter sp.]|nr:peptide transporter [Rhizobacter sp.]